MKKRVGAITIVVICALLAVTLAHSQTPATTATTNTTTVVIDHVKPQSTDTYAAKFICGTQRDQGAAVLYNAQPGSYSSKINVHNNTGVTINFRKKVIWLLKPGPDGEIGYNEQPTSPQAKKFDTLREDEALEVVCRDIYNMLGIPFTNPPYAEGFVIFEAYYQPTETPKPPPDPLDVEGIYTYRGFQQSSPAACCGVSINVVTYHAKSNSHVLN